MCIDISKIFRIGSIFFPHFSRLSHGHRLDLLAVATSAGHAPGHHRAVLTIRWGP